MHVSIRGEQTGKLSGSDPAKMGDSRKVVPAPWGGCLGDHRMSVIQEFRAKIRVLKNMRFLVQNPGAEGDR
jgi:hypothetical protein